MPINEIRGLEGEDSIEPIKPVRRAHNESEMSEDKPFLTAKERVIEQIIGEIAESEYRLAHEDLAPNVVKNLKDQVNRRKERLGRLREVESGEDL